jgi:hypothetical protein
VTRKKYGITGGVRLTDRLIERLADEAEAGAVRLRRRLPRKPREDDAIDEAIRDDWWVEPPREGEA